MSVPFGSNVSWHDWLFIKFARFQLYTVATLSAFDDASGSSEPRDKSFLVCFKCGEKGHYAKHCRSSSPAGRVSSKKGKGKAPKGKGKSKEKGDESGKDKDKRKVRVKEKEQAFEVSENEESAVILTRNSILPTIQSPAVSSLI